MATWPPNVRVKNTVHTQSSHYQHYLYTCFHPNSNKEDHHIWCMLLVKNHDPKTACLKTSSQKGWKENKEHEQTNKGSSSGLHSAVFDAASIHILFLLPSSLPKKGMNGRKAPAGQSQLNEEWVWGAPRIPGNRNCAKQPSLVLVKDFVLLTAVHGVLMKVSS